MSWNDLRKEIVKECHAQKKDDDYIKKYIAYSKNLFDQNLPIIASPYHFSLLIGLEHDYVCRMAYSPEHFYRHFEIQKPNGKTRSIDEPLPDLKYVQQWILTNILEKIPVSRYAKAFIKGRSVKENARFHKNQSIVVVMDIKDFFPSIRINSIVEIFIGLGYVKNVAEFLSYLCCYNYALPQGAPTSPYLSNLKMRNFDAELVKYVTPIKIRYTRYADDLTFSGDFNIRELIATVRSMLFEEGFLLNSSKTRVLRRNSCQEVTGIVVNDHLQVSKEERKKIRQEVYYIRKFGVNSHLSYINETREHYLKHLLGKINFARHINPHDTEMQEYFNYIKSVLINAHSI